MRKKTLILYLLLLVAPTLLIGVMAMSWIRREDERLRMLGEQAIQEQASIKAGNLDLLLREITDALLEARARIAPQDVDALYRWRARHPMVRNVFEWSPETLLRVPDTRWPDIEEQTFVQRYEALFSGRRAWPETSVETQDPPPPPRPPMPVARQARMEAAQRHQAAETPVRGPRQPDASGWLPWFWEHDIHLLGWIRTDDGATIRGVELELLAVLARFQPFFAPDSDRRIVYALSDHHGAIVMRTDNDHDPLHTASPAGSPQPVSELLPNWHVHALDLGPRTGAGVSFVMLAGMLTATLVIAILSGGALLLWQGYRDTRDAARKTSFVSNVSHELKTPLTTLRMYAEMLLQNRVPTEQKRQAYVETIANESARLTRLVNNVLDFSRLEQGRKTYRHERINVTDITRATIAAHADRFQSAGIRLECRVQKIPVSITGDRDALEQVLLNLLDNALKYAPAGGEVTVTLVETPTHVTITVADRGPGVAREHRERIFESFYRVDDSLTTQVPGSGLGLSIGRRLIRDLGGDLLYRPRDGGGSVFEMQWPKETIDD